MAQTPTPSELKARHQEAYPNSPYFSRKTMKAFGDTMANYLVRKSFYFDRMGKGKRVLVLSRKAPVALGLQTKAYFCAETYAYLGVNLNSLRLEA